MNEQATVARNLGVQVDELITAVPGEWKFDHEVAANFDAHVRRSVPFYDQVQHMIVDMSEWFVHDGMSIYDLGSATGETIALLQERHANKRDIRFIGVDNSLPMIEKARQKCRQETAQFLYQNITDIAEFSNTSLIVSVYTLQFIPLAERRRILERIHSDLSEGGALIIVEKVRGETSLFEDIWVELYWDMKQQQGLNSDQVIAKARSLRGVLMPLTVSENVRLLHESGFGSVDIFMKSYNFTGFIAVKMEKGADVRHLSGTERPVLHQALGGADKKNDTATRRRRES